MSTATATTQTELLPVAVPMSIKTSYDQATQTDAQLYAGQVPAAIETPRVPGELVPLPDDLDGLGEGEMTDAQLYAGQVPAAIETPQNTSANSKKNMAVMASDGPSPNSLSLRLGLPAPHPSRRHYAQSLLGPSFHDPRTHHVLESGELVPLPDDLDGLGEGEMTDASKKPPKKRMFKPCVHNIRKDTCRVCSPKSYCEHKRLRSTCVPCAGSQICMHKRQKNTCPECDGAPGVCIHKKAKRTCRQCSIANGTYVALVRSTRIRKSSNKDCEHNVRKANCRVCSKHTFCVHNRKKDTCIPCNGKLVCEHKKQRNSCISCAK